MPSFTTSPTHNSTSSDSESTNTRPSRAIVRSMGACVHCKSLKVRCEFNAGDIACQRCIASNFQCLARTRKKRKAAPTHEDLQERSLTQDLQIKELLVKLDQIKEDSQIRHWMVKAQSDIAADIASTDPALIYYGTADASGMAVQAFAPQGMPLPISPPNIVKYCALYPAQINELFRIFFDRINPFFSILDPELHTPERLIWTSPFLFTVICSTASRYYSARPNLYYIAKDFAREAAGQALVDGSKSVDVCQAYLLLAVYPVPKKKWAEDRSWLLMGVAIRMALELELNQPPPSDMDEREALNRTRTWLNCFCVDGSHAIQFGKLPMLRLDDYVARRSPNWYKTSRMNIDFDIHLCAYVDLIILMAKWRNRITEGNENLKRGEPFDLVRVCIDFDSQLSRDMGEWIKRYAMDSDATPICVYRGKTTQMIAAYLRLVVLSLAFQHQLKTGIKRDSYVVRESIVAAESVINIMVDQLAPTGTLRYAMAAHFLYVSFAAAFLLNFLRTKLVPLLDDNKHRDIKHNVRRLIGVLGSERGIALDGRHTPALYSRFLQSLLAKYIPEESTYPDFMTTSEDVKVIHHHPTERQPSPYQTWPDISVFRGDASPPSQSDLPAGTIYQHSGEADMDFSLTHFMQSVSQGQPFDERNQSGSSTMAWEQRTEELSQLYQANMLSASSNLAGWDAFQYQGAWSGQH